MMFMNFAHFNASFTPLGSEKLRQLAFAYDSPVEGRWPAELLKTVCSKAAPDNVVLEPRHDSYCMLLGTHKKTPHSNSSHHQHLNAVVASVCVVASAG